MLDRLIDLAPQLINQIQGMFKRESLSSADQYRER